MEATENRMQLPNGMMYFMTWLCACERQRLMVLTRNTPHLVFYSDDQWSKPSGNDERNMLKLLM